MHSIAPLLAIMARLRDPEGGCPWDLEQNAESISPHTIEEAYEVDEAIASGDLEALRDELGDLLFQVVFQARIAEEQGAFDFTGVVEAIVDKLVRRHPHVFADAATASTIERQRANWEQIKSAERAAARRATGGHTDPFSGIPRNLPALARSAKIAGRLEQLAEHDPESLRDALVELAKVALGVRDLGPSLAQGATGNSDEGLTSGLRQKRLDLVGRGLHAWVRLARTLGVDPEQALRRVDDEIMAKARANSRQASDAPLR
ncbi:MAG: MazG family protein [Myxococcota bacterium]